MQINFSTLFAITISSICLINTCIMIYELPSLPELKEILKDTSNIAWMKRVKWEGTEEQKEYVKRKIKELDAFYNTEENNHISSSI